MWEVLQHQTDLLQRSRAWFDRYLPASLLS